MERQPHILALQRERQARQAVVAIGAIRLSRMAAYELVRQDSDDPQSYAHRLLGRQVDFVGCLAYPEQGRGFDLRFVATPDVRTPTRGNIDIGLLVRTCADTEADAVSDASELVREVWNLLASGFPEYEFDIVADEAEFLRLYQPFPFHHVAEIIRREDRIPLDSVVHKRPRRGIGFRRPERPGASPAVSEPHGVYYVFPFTRSLSPLHRLLKEMLYQRHPVLISVGLCPTELTAAEEEGFEGLVGECERFVQAGPAGAVVDVSRFNPSLQVYAEALRQAIASQAMRLQDAPFLLRIQLAGPEPISQGLVDTLGVEITETVGNGSQKAAPVLIRHLAGGYDWVVPASADRLELAASNLRYLEHQTWVASLAPESLQRWRYLVDPEEANAAFRFPVPQPEDPPSIELKLSRTAPVPGDLPSEGVLLGINRHLGSEQPVYLPLVDRRRHLYAVGQTGTGKTTFFESMIMQDLRAGRGLCVLDPHGDLIERVVPKIPENRVDDVILFDASERDHPFGLNLLQWEDEDHKYFLTDETLAIIRRLVPDPQMRGPVFEHYVRMAVVTLMANPADPGTLVEFPRMYSDPKYHQRWLPFVQDPLVRQFWEQEYARTSDFHRSEMLAYVVSKFDPLIFDPLMRNIVGQRRSSLDFRELIETRKVLLVNLAKGRLGEMNANLLGMVLVAKFQAAALARPLNQAGAGREYFLYVDEFQNIATDSFATLMCEARKYGLGLVVTNQYISQLLDVFNDPEIVDAIVGNVGTLVCFRIGPKDADFLVPKFAPTFGDKDLLSLSNFEMYVATTIGGEALRPFSLRLERDTTPGDARLAALIRLQSLKRYGRPREEVEAEVIESLLWKAPGESPGAGH